MAFDVDDGCAVEGHDEVVRPHAGAGHREREDDRSGRHDGVRLRRARGPQEGEAEVVETYDGSVDSYFTASVNECLLGKNAALTVNNAFCISTNSRSVCSIFISWRFFVLSYII